MGIFIKFECDKCGEKICICDKYIETKESKVFNYKLPNYNYKAKNKNLSIGDIICESLDEQNNPINEFLVTNFTKDGLPIGRYLSDHKSMEFEYLVTPYYKICNI